MHTQTHTQILPDPKRTELSRCQKASECYWWRKPEMQFLVFVHCSALLVIMSFDFLRLIPARTLAFSFDRALCYSLVREFFFRSPLQSIFIQRSVASVFYLQFTRSLTQFHLFLHFYIIFILFMYRMDESRLMEWTAVCFSSSFSSLSSGMFKFYYHWIIEIITACKPSFSIDGIQFQI